MKDNKIYMLYRKIYYHLCRFRCKYIPYLVYRNKPIYARLVFDASKVNYEDMCNLRSCFHKLGITFDSGAGFGDIDWEFDWSLKGPIKVVFTGKPKKK